jgi:adenosylcobyric acid synthase
MRKLVIFELPFRGRDEFLPLAGNPCLDVKWVKPQNYRGDADVIILPGSGRTMSDLVYLRENGGDRLIREHLSRGGTVIGICGGFQMLGEKLFDPYLKQGEHTELTGFGLLPLETTFGPSMIHSHTRALLALGIAEGGSIEGVEVRSGYSELTSSAVCERYLSLNHIVARDFQQPKPESKPIALSLSGAERLVDWRPGNEKQDGLVSSDRKVWGTYIHLIFHNPAFCRTFFATLP